MPRFYIHFQKGDQVVRDNDGRDLPGFKEAKAIAMASAREILAEDIRLVADNPLNAVIITDDGGRELTTIPVIDVLPEPLKD
jgi:hypothetical protein